MAGAPVPQVRPEGRLAEGRRGAGQLTKIPRPRLLVAATGRLAAVCDVERTWRGFDPDGRELFTVPGGGELVALSAGGGAAAALLPGGALWTWTAAESGERGIDDRVAAVAVSDDARAIALLRAGEPARLEVDGAAVELPALSAGRLHGDETLGCLVVEGAAAIAEPPPQIALGPDRQPFWSSEPGVAEVVGPVTGGAFYSASQGRILRRSSDGDVAVADGTPADALSVCGGRLLAARPLSYQESAARMLLRVLDATTLEEVERREALVTRETSTAVALTPAGDILALRPDAEGRALEREAL